MKTLSLLATAVVLFSMTASPALAQVPGLVDGTQNSPQSLGGGGRFHGGGFEQYNMQTQVPSQMGQMQNMQNMQAFGQMPVPGNGMMNGFDMGGSMNAGGMPQQGMSATQGSLSSLQNPNLSQMSPYDQQEQAIEESRMMSQLEELKQKRENDESFRTLSGQADEKQARKMAKFDKQFDPNSGGGGGGNGGPGMFKGLASGMGKVVRGTMGVALPAGAMAGQYFLLKSAMGGGGGRMMMMPPGSAIMMMGR